MVSQSRLLPELDAFASAHGLSVQGEASAGQFAAKGESGGRAATIAQGFILHPRGGGKIPHFRLTFEPYVRDVHWLLVPDATSRWVGAEVTHCTREDVPGWARFGDGLRAFAGEVKTHWQLKLGEQGRLYLEALACVSPRAWELAWSTLDGVWEAS